MVSYDSRGRVLRAADAAGNVTTTAYTTGAGGQVTQITQTTPDPDGSGPKTAFTTTKTFNPVTGWLVETKDQNNKKTTSTYDALGRVLTVRYPQHQTATAPSLAYEYVAQSNGLNAVVTKTIGPDGAAQSTNVQLLDGLLRPFQTQSDGLNAGATDTASAGDRGRVVTHTFYDSAGRVMKQTGQWLATGVPSTTPIAAEQSPPSQTTYTYDGAGRVVQETLWNGTDSNPAYEVWRTVTAYDGSTTLIIPPNGGVPTEQVVNPRGPLVQLKEHARNPITQSTITTAAAVLALPATTTSYGYDAAGNLISMTDPAGNSWTYTFDKTGRQTTAVDPDSGTTTTTYDVLGQVVTRTNGNAKTLAYTYDNLGRPLTVRDNTTTGTIRAKWEYDQATDAAGATVRGPVSSTTRVTTAGDLVQATTKYDDAGNPLQVTTTLPNDAARLQSPSTYEPDCALSRNATEVRQLAVSDPELRRGPGGRAGSHYALGSVARFLTERITGLTPEVPGYRVIGVRPLVGGGLTSARASVATPYGLAESEWSTDGVDVRYRVTVPPGARARFQPEGDVSSLDLGPGAHAITRPRVVGD